jgi:hypothetical protein
MNLIKYVFVVPLDIGMELSWALFSFLLLYSITNSFLIDSYVMR